MAFRRKFHLSPSEKRGFLVIFLALLLYVAGSHFFSSRHSSGNEPVLSEQEQREIDRFNRERHNAGHETNTQDGYGRRREAETFPFDPNTADSVTFVRLGLTSWQARNALKYRRKGGRWKSADDFARLYGLSEEDFLRLRPYIRISPDGKTARQNGRSSHRDTTYDYYRSQKFREGTVIDINASDTTQLKRIPGIGSYYAGKICRYRERLGGFVSIRQIKEVEGLPPGVEKWFSIEDAPTPRRINVNKADFKQLVRHPYLSYEQVKAICTYIRKYGSLKSWKELRLLDEFTDKDFERLEPYFTF